MEKQHATDPHAWVGIFFKVSNCIPIPPDLYTFGEWTNPECTESCGSLGVLKKTRKCTPKDATVFCTEAETEKDLGTPCNRTLCPIIIAAGVGAAFATVLVIVIVSVVMLKRRRKRSHSEGSIWSTNSVTNQKDTQVERTTQSKRLPQDQKPIFSEKPIQPVKPTPRQAEKPVVPARRNPTSEARITASAVGITRPVLEVETVEAEIPSHCILRKDSHLKNNHKNLAKNEALLHEEFFQIGVFVRDHVKKDRNMAKQPEYKLHNRYRDIGKSF